MKKFVVLSLVSMLVLAFGGIVYAQEKAPALEFKPSGFLHVITEYTRNIPQGGSAGSDRMFQTLATSSAYYQGGAAYDKKQAYIEQRARLKFEAIMGKEVSGTIFFEMDSSKWGERPATGTSSASESGKFGAWGGDRVAVEVKNVFITFAVPGLPIPVTVQPGLQTIAVRSGVFLFTDGTGIVTTAKIDPATIRLIWAKPVENLVYSSDDVDVYGVDASAKIETFTIGGYGVNYNFNTYKFFGSADLESSTIDYKANMWWLGLYADGKLGPVNINFDFSYDTGAIEDHRGSVAKASRARDVKYRGFITKAQVDFPWEKFNLGTVLMYASGADAKKTDVTGMPAQTTAYGGATSSRVGAYVLPPNSEAQGGDAVVFYGAGLLSDNNTKFAGWPGTQMARGPNGGTWFAKLYGSYKATPWYKVTLQGLYIGDTTKNGNTIGNAVKSDGTLSDDKSIGWELDVINEIEIYKSLKWNFGGGILFAGDAMDHRIGSTYNNDSPKNPWAIQSRLIFTF